MNGVNLPAAQSNLDIAMKVLHLFGSMTRNGAQLRTIDVTNEPCFDGHVFDYCSLSGMKGELDDSIRTKGGEVYYLKIYSLIFPIILFIHLKRNKYDIVHSHVHHTSGFILLIAWLAGVSGRVAHFRNTTSTRGSRNNTIFEILKKTKIFLISKFATDILAVNNVSMSGAWGDNWAADYRCKVIYNGIGSNELGKTVDPKYTKEALGINNDVNIIIHVGRFDPEKNHIFVVETFRELLKLDCNLHLLLVGKAEGKIKKEVERLINEYDLSKNVSILGMRDDVIELLYVADLMIFPSLWEGLPGALLESLSVGTQVLASDIPPTKEVNQYVSGLKEMSLTESPTEWALVALQLLDEGRTNKNLKEGIRNKFVQAPFTLSVCASELNGVWNKYRQSQ